MKSLRLQGLERWIVPVLILVGWEIFSRSGTLPAALLPAPTTVLRSWSDWVFATGGNTQTYSGSWIFDPAASTTRVLAGFGIAPALAVSLGVAIGWSRRIETIIEPTLQVLRPIPPVSWIPLAIIWFGIANKPAIFLVFLGSFFPILVNTIHGVKSCDRNLIRAGAMVGGDQRRLLRYIVLPAALPSIFAGLRIGIGSGGGVAGAGEAAAVKSGLGYVLWDSYYFLRYDLVLAAMASIGLLGYLSDLVIRALMARVLHGQRNTRIQGGEGGDGDDPDIERQQDFS